ncbi:MAG: SPOR domain-containing protein [Desulfovibrionales bacterium]|nr:SPOR domain-containing protein [Desulfovibrionales bacterium]
MLGPGVVPVKLEAVGTKGGKTYATRSKKRTSRSGSYYVQVGSFDSKQNALKLRQKIMHNGRSCRVFQDVSSSVWKVHVGPYFSYTAAERAKDRLDNTYYGAFVYAQ